MIKPITAAILNHTHGKHITVSLDAADPQRNAILLGIVDALRAADRERDATNVERLIDRVIVSRGVGPEIRTVQGIKNITKAQITTGTLDAVVTSDHITDATFSKGELAEESASALRSHFSRAVPDPIAIEQEQSASSSSEVSKP